MLFILDKYFYEVDMITEVDLNTTQLISRERIKGFLHDKNLLVVSKDMKKIGIGLSRPVLATLRNNDNDVHFLTLRKISYYINNYLNFK